MRLLYCIIFFGLLSFKVLTPKTNLNTEYLPNLYFKDNSIYYSQYVDNRESYKDSSQILLLIKSLFDKHPKLTIKLIGHSDFSEKHKIDLALNRAKKVCSDLVKLGVSRDRIFLKGESDSIPFITPEQQKGCENDIQCLTSLRLLNRRVNFLADLN